MKEANERHVDAAPTHERPTGDGTVRMLEEPVAEIHIDIEVGDAEEEEEPETEPRPMTAAPVYDELKRATHLLNSGATRSLLVEGNVEDLYFDPNADDGKGKYVPLTDLVVAKWNAGPRIVIRYAFNDNATFMNEDDRRTMRDAWVRFRTGLEPGEPGSRGDAAAKAEAARFDELLGKAAGNPSLALETLRQFCVASRSTTRRGNPCLPGKYLTIIVESAGMLVPATPIDRMSDADRHRTAILKDWITDPDFSHGDDHLVLVAEARGAMNDTVSRLPQLMAVEMKAPDEIRRRHCIEWFNAPADVTTVAMPEGMDFAEWTAGLSVHALMQLMRSARHEGGTITPEAVISAIEAYIKSQLGEDTVEFKRPTHGMDSLVGNTRLKRFLVDELIPCFQISGKHAVTGAVVSGAIGGGKTFIFEGVAAELKMPVLILKQIRSQWFGQTDVLMSRLHRLLSSLRKALISVDEADTQFSDAASETHATEKRVTGQILQMMSDPAFKGRIYWLLMTARVHLLPPDMLRPGRVGDMVIPVFDPEGDDRRAFIKWAIEPVVGPQFQWHKATEVAESWENARRLRDEVLKKKRLTAKEGYSIAGVCAVLLGLFSATWQLPDSWGWIAALVLVWTPLGIGSFTAFLLRSRNKKVNALLERIDEKHPTSLPFVDAIDRVTKGYSAGSFARLRGELRRKAEYGTRARPPGALLPGAPLELPDKPGHVRCNGRLTAQEVLDVVREIIQPDIADVREYQELQALVKCTRRSLLPELPEDLEVMKIVWKRRIKELEEKGIR